MKINVLTSTCDERYDKLVGLNTDENLNIQIETLYNGKYVRGRWRKFKSIHRQEFIYDQNIYHRQVKSNEIVFDLDYPTFEENKKVMYEILSALNQFCFKYYVYFSGGKGFHIHFFYNYFISELSEEQQKIFFYLEPSDRLYHIRLAIIKFLNIDLNHLDDLKLKSVNTLIRLEGSLHHKGFFKNFLGSSINDVKKALESKEYVNKNLMILDEIKYVDKINNVNLMKDFIYEYTEKYYNLLKKQKGNPFKVQQPINKIRKKVKQILTTPLCDGRKLALKILSWELMAFYKDENKVLELVKDWNQLEHSSGSLKPSVIVGQVKFVARKFQLLGENFKPFSNEKLKDDFNVLVFKK